MPRIELFLIWESNCRPIIDELHALPTRILDEIKVRVFLRKDTPLECRPPVCHWLEVYSTFTTAPHASDTTLAVFLIKYLKDLCFFSDVRGNIESSCEAVDFYLVVDSENERKFEELVAILSLECRAKVKMTTVNWQKEDVFKVLGFNFCRDCLEMFDTETALAEHDKKEHDFFCENEKCARNKIRFGSGDELQQHRALQTSCTLCHGNDVVFCTEEDIRLHMRVVHRQEVPGTDHPGCDFCPDKLFTSAMQRESHMRNMHKKCNCGCGVFFKSREHYIEHFYAVYPLACLENRKCPYRFQSAYHQAEHHREAHSCDLPYYCIACLNGSGKYSVQGTKLAFKDEQSLRRHGDVRKHTSLDMFLIEATSTKAIAKSSAINYC